ncbi:MAG: hypothetical protein L0211_09120 [Planctomycetaceae bacterium]|nr:hypothetical protein [Planctomycetaceae bacterium]
MDATTHIHVARTNGLDHELSLDLMCDAGGEHFVFIRATDDLRGRETLIGFNKVDWSRFKGSVLAVDRAIGQLRDKGLIFEFGPPRCEPQILEPKQPGDYRVKFIVEKMTANGLQTRECETLAEVADWIHGR